MKNSPAFTAILAAVLLIGCASPGPNANDSSEPSASAPVPTSTDTMSATTSTSSGSQEGTQSMDSYENKVAEIKTTKGTITVRFFPEVAPNHVKNFIDLAASGYYNGTRFHRTIPGFMIQGGDPNTKTDNASTWGTGGSGKNIKAEFNKTHHGRGILSMARSQSPDSASSQFFITVAEAGFLDNQYTVFGEVVNGMSVADAIVTAPVRPGTDMPVDLVKIESVTVRDAKPEEKKKK